MGTPTQHFKTGWNDLADGVLTWDKDYDYASWPNCSAWVKECKGVAMLTLKKRLEPHIEFYYRGIVAAADCYERSEEIEKL